MLNQIHQLLARRLVQKEEQPKANKFQFSTGFRVVSARAFAGTGRLLVLATNACNFTNKKAQTLLSSRVGIALLRITNKYADYFSNGFMRRIFRSLQRYSPFRQ
jgi:hypothetical protein